MNENTLSAVSGDTKTTFEVDLTGFTFGGLSDDVAEGRYEVECDSASMGPRKDGVGVNIRVDWRVVGPPCAEVGKHIIAYHPIPVGNPEDPDFRKKAFYLRSMIASIFSMAGKFGENLPNPGKVGLAPEALKGKHAAAYIVEDTYNDNPVGSVKQYLEAPDYQKNPGPVQGARGSGEGVRKPTERFETSASTTATTATTATSGSTGGAPANEGGRDADSGSDPVADFLGT